jgi:hypothetical protein
MKWAIAHLPPPWLRHCKHTSEVWSHFSTFFVNNKKQDFILFSICCNNYVYSYFES